MWRGRPSHCLLTWALLSGACSSDIALGSECADFAASCAAPVENRDDDPVFEAGPEPLDRDAGAPQVSLDATVVLPDAQPAPAAEASIDSGSMAGPVTLLNPSFEGPVGSVSPINSVDLTDWPSCGGNVSVVESASISAGFPAMQTTLLPSEGATFLELSLVGTGPGAVVQTLPVPLSVGVPYAFAMDVAQSGIGTATLELRSGKNSCTFATALAKTATLENDAAWHSVCLTVTPEAEVTDLALVMTASVAGVSVYVDHLRSVSACP